MRFEQPLLLTHDELWCPIDQARMPYGKSTAELRKEDVLQSLHDRVHAPVRVDTLPNGKICIVVRINAKEFPKKFSINSFTWDEDGDVVPSLAFPLGIDGERKCRWVDLAQVKHLLVVGSTGGGKSTFLHAMLQSFIARNQRSAMELILIDLKGQELNRYEKLMGSAEQPGVVRTFATEIQTAIEALMAGVKEIERRNKLLARADASDLEDLHRLTGLRGRMFFRHQGKTSEYQTCHIIPTQIRLETMRIARNGPASDLGESKETELFVRDAKLLVDIACKQFNGAFARRKILSTEDARGITQARFNSISDRLFRDGVLEKGHRGSRSVSAAFVNRPELMESMSCWSTAISPSYQPQRTSAVHHAAHMAHSQHVHRPAIARSGTSAAHR